MSLYQLEKVTLIDKVTHFISKPQFITLIKWDFGRCDDIKSSLYQITRGSQSALPVSKSLSLWEQRRRPPPAAETGRSCWGSGQQDASGAQRMLGAATRAVSPQVTERASPFYKSICTAISIDFLLMCDKEVIEV